MPDDAPQSPAQERSQAFVAVEGAITEDVAGGPLMLGAYAVVWVLVLGFVWRLVRLQSDTRAEIERLSKVLSRNNDSTG